MYHKLLYFSSYQMYMNNLTTQQAYEVKVRGATLSTVGEKKLHLGDWSESKAVFLQPGCEDMKHFQPSKAEERIILLNLEVKLSGS